MWIRWCLNEMCPVKSFREDVYLEYSKIGQFNPFTGWRNIKMSDLTGWRNMEIRWCLNKMCPVKSF